MAGGINRNQGKDLASRVAAIQDGNTFLTDGGNWSWDAGSGALAWDAAARVRRSGVAVHGILASSATLLSAGDCAYVTVNRTSGGPITVSTGAISDAANEDDDRLILAVRGTDDHCYLMDGTVLFDGDSKVLGTVNAATDRAEVTADGNALQTVPFTYVTGSDQLAVFVGGILQRVGTDYLETSGTQVTFQAGSIPTAGEIITYLNVIGGQGPAGVGSSLDLQDAFNNGQVIDTRTVGVPVEVFGDPAGGDLFYVGNTSNADAFAVTADGDVTARTLRLVDQAAGSDQWIFVHNGLNDLVAFNNQSDKAIRFDAATGGIEFGEFIGAGPFSSGGGLLRWTEFTGTFSAVAPTTIATGLASADIKGVALKAVNPISGRQQLLEMSLGSASTRAVYVSVDGAGNIALSGNTGGTSVVGSNLQGSTYVLVVFHE